MSQAAKIDTSAAPKGASFQEQARNLENSSMGVVHNPELEKGLPHQSVGKLPEVPVIEGQKGEKSASGVADPARHMAIVEHAQMEAKHGKAEPIRTMQASSPESDPIRAALNLPQHKNLIYSAGTAGIGNDRDRIALQELSTSGKKYAAGETISSAEYNGMNLVEKSKVGYPSDRDQNNPSQAAAKRQPPVQKIPSGGSDSTRHERHESR